MDFSQNKKNILLLGGLVIAGALYYFFVHAPANSTSGTIDETIAAELHAKTEKFIAHSELLQSLTIDTSITNEPALLNLVSYRDLVPDQSIGKSNIFDSIVTADGLE